jgi:hypothetical protein
MHSYSYHHQAVYAHHHAYAHYSNSAGGWFGHAIINGVIHAAIYHMIAPLFRGQGILGSLLIGAVILGCVFLAWRWLSRRRFA